jgi:hypothetical protein
MGIGVKYRFARGLWRWGRLADFWPRSGRYEADCPQRHSPYPLRNPHVIMLVAAIEPGCS